MDVAVPIIDFVERAAPLRRIDAGGSVFSYREAGDGSGDAPMMALLHGIGSGSGSWVHQLTALSDRFRVIAWDAPGYGESSALAPESPAASDYAGALERFFAALEVRPRVVVGHSLGALMAASYAVRHAEIDALILADPANGYGAADPAIRDEKLFARLNAMEKLGPEGLAQARASALLSDRASPEALALVRWSMSRLHADGHAQAAHMLAGGNLIADAARYHGRAFVLCGSEDKITPEEGCRRIADAFPDAIYRTLSGVGHASYVEDPAQFNTAIRELLEAAS